MEKINLAVFKPDVSSIINERPLEEKSTIMHFTLKNETLLRIWSSTFLLQEDGNRKKLLHAFNISEYPNWKYQTSGHTFTLIFEGLDNNCLLFDLFEDIPEEGGFHIQNIKRNKTDVYSMEI